MLQHTDKRILVKVIREQKNHYTFSNGVTIRLERDYNNMDRAYTQQTFGEVVSGEGIPEKALILFHFNAVQDSYRVFNHTALSGEEIASGIALYSIPETECFVWKMAGEKAWNPIGGFVLAERVFEPYGGKITGIEPKKLKDILYITTGEYKGLVVQTLHACDFRLHFRNEEGKDENLVRCRHFEGQSHEREEIIAIRHDLTEMVKKGKLLIGISASDAKPLNPLQYAH